MCYALFFLLTMVLSSFPGIIFNETNYDTKGFCALLPSLDFFPIGFLSSKVLMSHILHRHPKGNVMNIINGCPQTLCTYLLSDTILLIS
jgi:hypothetical protein